MSDSEALEKGLVLVQRLYLRTRGGKVDWEPTNDESVFAVQLGHFRVSLGEVPDPNYPDQPDFELLVIDESSGRTIERITNTTLRSLNDRLTEGGLSPYKVMERTYGMARRKALGVDDALEAILQDLAEGIDKP